MPLTVDLAQVLPLFWHGGHAPRPGVGNETIFSSCDQESLRQRRKVHRVTASGQSSLAQTVKRMSPSIKHGLLSHIQSFQGGGF
jgi:hypothetical protein